MEAQQEPAIRDLEWAKFEHAVIVEARSKPDPRAAERRRRLRQDVMRAQVWRKR